MRLNFAGTIDWAVDLQEFSDDDGCSSQTCGGNEGTGGAGTLYVGPEIYTEKKPTVRCDPPCQLIIPPFILPKPTTITLPPITTSLAVAWTETKTVTKDGTTSTSKFISRVVQTTTLIIPLVTTTAIEFWNDYLHTGKSESVIWLTWSILPPPFTITNDRNPENKSGVTHPIVTRTIYPPPWPYSQETPTTTPIPTTYGSSTLHASIPVTTTGGGKPGPQCMRSCGTKCKYFCDKPCLPGLCPPGGGSGGRPNDFDDPNDPNSPPPPKPPGTKPPPPPGARPCNVKPDIGRCPNGNLPIWDPSSGGIRCDLSDDKADDAKTQCQRELDQNLDKAKDDLEQGKSCCSAAKRDVLALAAAAAAAPKACPINPNYPTKPTQSGGYHSIFTCDFNLWPNVCANARSAILKRGKSDLLTYRYEGAGVDPKHSVGPWLSGKHWGKKDIGEGWALRGCEIEEFPFANGAPNRNPNNRKWAEQRVLRLIPQRENGQHGNAIKQFISQAGNGESEYADGLIYKIVFKNGPTGTSDDDFFLGTDTSKNICAQPYGNEYILVNKASVDTGERSWDPWWDSRLLKKTIDYKKNNKGTATSIETAYLPRRYCKYPSPGNLVWDRTQNRWKPEVNPPPKLDRNKGKVWYSCDIYAGYSGPAEIPPLAPGVGRRAVPEKNELLKEEASISTDANGDIVHENPSDHNSALLTKEIDISMEAVIGLSSQIGTVPEAYTEAVVDHVFIGKQNSIVGAGQAEEDQSHPLEKRGPKPISPQPRFASSLVPRASGGGSFLDPNAFNFLCGIAEDQGDPCPNGCFFPTGGEEDIDDDGSWGNNGSPVGGGNGGGGDNGGSEYDWRFQWAQDNCTKPLIAQEGSFPNLTTCNPVPAPFIDNRRLSYVLAFLRSGYRACFYNSTNCAASNDTSYISLSGGGGEECLKFPDGGEMSSYEIVQGNCTGDWVS